MHTPHLYHASAQSREQFRALMVAYLVKGDADHRDAAGFLDDLQRTSAPLLAPSILLPEVGGALARQVNTPAANDAVQWIGAGIVEILPVTEELAKEAAGLAVKWKIRGCDAVYAALAKHYGMELVSLDKQQRERSAKAVKTLKPGEWRGKF